MGDIEAGDRQSILRDIEELQSNLRLAALQDVAAADRISRRIDHRMKDLIAPARETKRMRHRAEAGALIEAILSQPDPSNTNPQVRRPLVRRILDLLPGRPRRRPNDTRAASDRPISDERPHDATLLRLRNLIDMSLEGESTRVVALDLNADRLRHGADLCAEVSRHMRRDFEPAERIACASDATRELLRELGSIRITCLRPSDRSTAGVSFEDELRLATMFVKSVEYVEDLTYRASDEDLRSVASRLDGLETRLRAGADAISRDAWRIRIDAVGEDETRGVRASDLAKAVHMLDGPNTMNEGEAA